MSATTYLEPYVTIYTSSDGSIYSVYSGMTASDVVTVGDLSYRYLSKSGVSSYPDAASAWWPAGTAYVKYQSYNENMKYISFISDTSTITFDIYLKPIIFQSYVYNSTYGINFTLVYEGSSYYYRCPSFQIFLSNEKMDYTLAGGYIDVDLDGYDDDSFDAGFTSGENYGYTDARNEFAFYDTVNDEWLGFYSGQEYGYVYGVNKAHADGFTSVGFDPLLSYDWTVYYADHIDDTKIAIKDFIPGILGSIFSFFFQLSSIEFLGISALDILGMMAVVALVLLFFKVFVNK